MLKCYGFYGDDVKPAGQRKCTTYNGIGKGPVAVKNAYDRQHKKDTPTPIITVTEDKIDPYNVSYYHLGSLPSELFDKILFEINSIYNLAYFIATARFVYQRLGPALADARFLFVFPHSDPIDQIRGNALPYPEELKGLCRTLYQINFIADIYVTTRLVSFDLGGGGGTPATAPLSPLERRRLVRSFYRRQILSNAWATTRCTRPTRTRRLLATRQIDHAEVFITCLCLALVYHSPRTADRALGILPHQFDELSTHLHRLIQFLDISRPAIELAHYVRLHDEYVNPYQITPLRLAWQAERAASFLDPVPDKWDRDGLVVPYVGDGLDLALYGWLDTLGGRYVKWFGEGLHSIPWLPTRQSHRQSSDQCNAMYLSRHAGFCLMFWGELCTGLVLNRLIERDD
ncbi:hypothetical protein C7999DRAFT_44983 [Corynascus novoguineensis]|uniref:Uncharacterized protein n=1 Tax=Corynascus novoguineensis TaxID=1126955 RepID=A0AAN7HAY9_9PEZI|nr:hypothetical protein C7999DRAFT_44983 [Corynascus novoguineensis]